MTRLYCFAPVKMVCRRHRLSPPILDQQGLADLEIIVLADGSTDGTADAVSRGGRARPLPTAQQVTRAPASPRSP
jgi:hypothetical protein